MLKVVLTLITVSAVFGANDPDCGTKGPSTVQRIVGGANTAPLEFPWQGSLQAYSASVGWYHTCGCSLLNKDWILTAAHCVDRTSDVTQYRVILGEHDRSKDEGTEITLTITKLFKHPNWNANTIDNDVAVLKLSRSVDLSGAEGYLGTVCLPDKEPLDQILGSNPCIATGWGNTQWQGTSPNILQKATVSVVAAQTCVNIYASIHRITDGMICFGENGKGTCQGDSGGPLNCQIGGKWYSYGATSFGVQCAGPTYPSASARNSEFSAWIWSTIDVN